MSADGSGRARLTGTEGGGMPTWSPDGQRIAFHAMAGGRNDIVVARLDGRGRVRLTRGAEGWLRH